MLPEPSAVADITLKIQMEPAAARPVQPIPLPFGEEARTPIFVKAFGGLAKLSKAVQGELWQLPQLG